MTYLLCGKDLGKIVPALRAAFREHDVYFIFRWAQRMMMGRRPTSISKIVMRNDLFDRLLHMYWDKPKGLTSYILLRVTPAMILLVYFVVWDLNSSLVRKTQSIWRPNSVFPGQNPSGRILRTGPRQLFVHATDLPRQGAAWAARGVRAPSTPLGGSDI